MTSPPTPLRIALIGCGQIADAHLAQIGRLKSASVVAVCDTYEDLAWQAAQRFHVPAMFTDLDRMLEDSRPQVVHITTPAHTHAPLAKKLLHAGCHVYVEKPFTLDAAEADEVLLAAGQSGKSICLGHDQLFDPAWLRCRQLVKRGAIGTVRHVDSILGYPLTGSFGSLVAGDPLHPVRRLPGGLFQNTISHPLYRITDFLHDDSPRIRGGWHTRPDLDFPTELSISLQGDCVTGSLTFATNIPPQRITRIYGTSGSLEVDLDTQVVRHLPLSRFPGAFGKLEAPFQQWRNSTANLARNCWRFLKGDIHYFAGMKNLFEAFYRSIHEGLDPPVSFLEMRRVTALMDNIFAHCRQDEHRHSSAYLRGKSQEVPPCP